MAAVNFYQVTSYPASPVANALYFLKRSGSKADLRLTDSAAAYYDIATDSKVLNTVLSGLSIVNGSIISTDTILEALGKAQGQANAISASLTSTLAALNAHIADTANPHAVTKSQVGLSNVDNTSDTNKPVSTAQATAIAVVQADIDTHEANTSNPHSVTKAQVGLSNADNTSDANKPVSTAQAAADAATLASAQSYADGLVLGLLDDRGNYDASGNVFPSSGGSGTAGAIMKGDLWTISVAGTLGGHPVTAGDVVRALINTPGQTDANWAISENNIGYVAENSANKDIDGTLAANSDVKYPSQKAVKTYADTKVAGNVAITGATKTKVTYDSKGLVTAGADATTADIADSSNKRYVTDAQLTVLGNTSGTNSGNETTTTVGALINGATDKPTPVDADYVGLMDSAASNILKKLSWANIKATLKTYFDSLYTYNNVADFTIEPAVDQTAQGPRTNDLNAGATISIMELVILDSSSKWQKTDANSAALYAGMLAMALEAGTNNNPMLVAFKGSVIRNDAWAWTPGAVLYMSETAGAITATQPSTADVAIRVIGYALTDDCIYFDPSPDYIVHT